MATTVDIACPRCGRLVCCDYFKGRIHDFLFDRFMLTSFRLECECGNAKNYWLVSPKKLEAMYPTAPNPTAESDSAPYYFGPRDLIPEHLAFLDVNDHNPTIETDCPTCGGTGRELAGARNACPICGGSGRRRVPFFANANNAMDADVNDKGSCKCPNCGFVFSLSDKKRWTGLRHAKCGQKIRLRR